MEFILPQPKELIVVVLLAVFMLFHFERRLRILEHRFRVQKAHTFVVALVMVLPLFFVHWQTEDELMLVSQLMSYALAVGVCSLFGMISAPESKDSKI